MTVSIRTPAVVRRAVQGVLLAIRDFLLEKDKCTHMVVGGHIPVASEHAPVRLSQQYARIVSAAAACRSKRAVQAPSTLLGALSRLDRLHERLRIADDGAGRAMPLVDATSVAFQRDTIMTWSFTEELQAILIELETFAVVPAYAPNGPLNETEVLVLEILETARTTRGGRGITVPEIWRELPKLKRVSEDRIGKVIRGLRRQGVPLPNTRNRGGYLLLEPLSNRSGPGTWVTPVSGHMGDTGC